MARGISPETNGGASLGSSAKNWANLFTQNITLSNNFDLTGSSIVAKSLGENGYIKYASGLIMQWGVVGFTESGSKEVSFPIGFSTSYKITTGNEIDALGNIPQASAFPSYSDRLNKFIVQSSRDNNVNWFAIGY
jgi:hypothetical protein